MEIVKGACYGVITGDIIKSSGLSTTDRQRLVSVLKTGSEQLRILFPELVPMEVDVFRGDGWQFIVTQPSRTLRAALFYRAWLKANMLPAKIDSRLVIALGSIDFIGKRVSESDGEAFRLSGKTLESLGKSVTMRLAAPALANAAELDIIVQLLDVIARRWTPRQALATTGALRGWKQEKIASLWGEAPIAQQTVVKHLNTAEWPAVNRALEMFEKLTF